MYSSSLNTAVFMFVICYTKIAGKIFIIYFSSTSSILDIHLKAGKQFRT